MARNLRRTVTDLTAQVGYLSKLLANGVVGYANIANGTTAGKLKSQNTTGFRVDGVVYTKNATDDLWDLTGIATMSTGQYRAVTLYLDASGTATIDTGTVAASAALALAACPAIPATKSIIGVFVAGPSTNFGSALTSQGTLYHGVPPGYGTCYEITGAPAGFADFVTIVAP